MSQSGRVSPNPCSERDQLHTSEFRIQFLEDAIMAPDTFLCQDVRELTYIKQVIVLVSILMFCFHETTFKTILFMGGWKTEPRPKWGEPFIENAQQFYSDAQPPTSILIAYYLIKTLFQLIKELLHPDKDQFGSFCSGESHRFGEASPLRLTELAGDWFRLIEDYTFWKLQG